MFDPTRSTRRRGAGLLAVLSALAASPLAAQQLTSNQIGTPNDGVFCRAGYAPSFNGSSLLCTKTLSVTLNLQCPSQFPNYVVRAVSSPGTPDGRDLCTRAAISIGSTDAVGGLVPGRDYIKADVPQGSVDSAAAATETAEEAALGLSPSEVEGAAQTPVIDTNASGSRDKGRVGVRLYTFAAPQSLTRSAAARQP